MQILSFIQNHWMLVAAFVSFVLAYGLFELRLNMVGPKRLSPALATQFMNHQNPMIFDIRDKTKFQAGHILNAQSIAQAEVENTLKQLKKGPETPILLICQTGQQSVMLGNRLKKQGFTEVVCLAGGMNAWQAADLPVDKR